MHTAQSAAIHPSIRSVQTVSQPAKHLYEQMLNHSAGPGNRSPDTSILGRQKQRRFKSARRRINPQMNSVGIVRITEI